MILLAVTMCIAANGSAECARHTQLLPDMAECRKIGAAHEEYLANHAEIAGGAVIFLGHQCSTGKDS